MFEEQLLTKTVFEIKDLPEDSLPDVITCGRSNVGKSSFINTLFNRTNLARTSSTPGKTRSINFYLIDKKFYIVDLPGFGYAKISKKEREYWKKLISLYFQSERNKALAVHLVDSRHKPTELDIHLNGLLQHHQIPYIVLLSKVDKLKQSEIKKSIQNTTEIFPELVYGENLALFSSVKKTGRKKVLSLLASMFMK
jgi:GTP-binding protein